MMSPIGEGGVVGSARAGEEAFVACYAAKGEMLRRTAFALCGDCHLADGVDHLALKRLTCTNASRARHAVVSVIASAALSPVGFAT
jgi:hypothetical protein